MLVFNGKIYNYRELRRRLEDAGHVFATQGDGEVLHGATARRFFRTEVLDALIDEHRSGARSHMKRIWSAYCFTSWHEAYFG